MVGGSWSGVDGSGRRAGRCESAGGRRSDGGMAELSWNPQLCSSAPATYPSLLSTLSPAPPRLAGVSCSERT